jgi:tetratricopeptide (TPR) repeat protein
MRRKLQELTDTVAEFVDQGDNLTLVLGTDDASMPLVVKTIEGLDQQNDSDLFLLFPDDAGPPDAYLSAIATRLEAQLMVANDLRKEKGEPAWPGLPVACHDVREPPAARLRAAIEHVRGLMPPDGDHRLVWALLPLAIKDQVGYAQIVGQLIPRTTIEPWMRGTRFLVRDEREPPFLIPALKKRQAQGVLVYRPDFSAAAVEAELNKDALDPEAPVPERMQALMQLAGLDYAHQRFPEAIEKYGILFAYYREHDAKEMQGICLQGIGDILRRSGKPVEAKTRYQQGLAICAESPAVVVTMNLCVAAGDVSLELRQLPDAAGYFELAEQIATKIINPFVKADCMEKRGQVLELQNDPGGAVRLWRDCAGLCRQFEYRHRLVSVLERMRAWFKKAAMRKELREVETELDGLRAAAGGKS